jgi:ribulose-phosphate 3-epimerase
METRIAPSLLAADFARLGEEVRAVEAAGADFLHLDVMDGRFVPNLSVGVPVLRSLKRITRVPVDAHLMVEDPDVLLEDFLEAGADNITVHVEACRHLDRTIRLIKGRGVKAGVALNPATPLSSIFYVLGMVDLVLIMSVNPGFGGQRFIDYTINKIAALRSEIDHHKLDVMIQVDGGVNAENAGKLAKAGADILVAGTAVFGTSDYGIAMEKIRSQTNRANAEK